MARIALQNKERLSTSLQAYHINALQEIAETLALRPNRSPVRKDWLVSELSQLIPARARSEEAFESLSPAERGALGVILEAGGKATFREVAIPLLLAGLVKDGGDPGNQSLPTLRDVLLTLARRGLIVNLTDEGNNSALRTLTHFDEFGIAPEVRNALPARRLRPPAPRPAGTYLKEMPPANVQSRELQQFMRELFFTWAELRREPARQLKAGGMGKRDRRRIAQMLGLDEEEEGGLARASELYELLSALNLVSGNDGEITAVEGSAVTLFWNATPIRQLHDLSMAYGRLNAPLPDEETRKHLYDYSAGWALRPPAEIREQVLATVMQVADLGWIPFSLLAKLLTGGRIGTLILGEETMTFVLDNLRWYGLSYRTDMESNLQKLEQVVAQEALQELCSMGIVELGYDDATTDDQREAKAVRATGLVQTYCEERPRHEQYAEEAWQVILQPDFQMLAMGPVPLRVLANLDQFAAREKIDESVITYRLTRDGAYQAFQRGETVQSILTYLEEATGQPTPQNVKRSLEEWSHQHDRILLRRKVNIVQVYSAEILEALLEDAVMQRYLHPLDDTTAWMKPEDADTIEKRLLELDVLPAHSSGPQEDLPDSLRWHGNELEPRAPLPSLYVTGTLRRIAEPHEGRWQMTPDTIQQATSFGADILEIIATLEEMTGEPLPEEWVRRLKAWGKYYGDSQVATVRLLRLPQAQALEELRRADSQLHRWLRPLPGTTNMAVVNEDHWDEIVELLASWGIEVESDRWW